MEFRGAENVARRGKHGNVLGRDAYVISARASTAETRLVDRAVKEPEKWVDGDGERCASE